MASAGFLWPASLKSLLGASLVAQGLRRCTPKARGQVQPLVIEGKTTPTFPEIDCGSCNCTSKVAEDEWVLLQQQKTWLEECTTNHKHFFTFT